MASSPAVGKSKRFTGKEKERGRQTWGDGERKGRTYVTDKCMTEDKRRSEGIKGRA